MIKQYRMDVTVPLIALVTGLIWDEQNFAFYFCLGWLIVACIKSWLIEDHF